MAKRQRKYRIEIENVFGAIVTIEPPFTIEFEIEKAVQSVVSSGEITIYNLGESTRSALYKDLIQVSTFRKVAFYAGYETDSTLACVFSGTVAQCYSLRHGVDFLTTIVFNSGSEFLFNSKANELIPSGTTFKEAATGLALKIVKPGSVFIGNFPTKFKRDTPLFGDIEKVVSELTKGSFFIDNDQVFCISDDEYISGVVNLINSESGLLGSPQVEETFITFDMIFEPRLMMYQKIELQSETNKFFSGTYRVVSMHHTGMISESMCGEAKTSVRVQQLGIGSNEVLPQ